MFNSLKKKKISWNLLCCICVLRKALPSLVGQKPPWQSHLLPMLGALFMNFTGLFGMLWVGQIWIHQLTQTVLSAQIPSWETDLVSSVRWPLWTCFSSTDCSGYFRLCIKKLDFIYLLFGLFFKSLIFIYFFNQNHVLWQHLTEQFHFKGVLASFYPLKIHLSCYFISKSSR